MAAEPEDWINAVMRSPEPGRKSKKEIQAWIDRRFHEGNYVNIQCYLDFQEFILSTRE